MVQAIEWTSPIIYDRSESHQTKHPIRRCEGASLPPAPIPQFDKDGHVCLFVRSPFSQELFTLNTFEEKLCSHIYLRNLAPVILKWLTKVVVTVNVDGDQIQVVPVEAMVRLFLEDRSHPNAYYFTSRLRENWQNSNPAHLFVTRGTPLEYFYSLNVVYRCLFHYSANRKELRFF
jgi:hypothetical protein